VSPADVVALPGWRWMPGMLARERGGPRSGTGWRLARAASNGEWLTGPHAFVARCGGARRLSLRGCVPSRDDPATLGCLLALVREAWGDPAAHVAPYTTWVRGPSGDLDERGWWLRLCRQDGGAYRSTDGDGVSTYLAGPTEWDALVAALAAAPGRAS